MSADLLVRLLVVVGGVLLVRPGPAPRSVPSPEPRRSALPVRATVRRFGDAPKALAERVLTGARRRPGTSALVVVAAVVVGPFPVAVVAALVGLQRWWTGRRRSHREAGRVADELPDVLDLLRLAVAAGCTVHLAVEALGHHGRGVAADRVRHLVDRVRRGALLAEALDDLRQREPAMAPVADALIAADRYGTPLEPVLARLADDARASRRRRSEAAARRVPVQLLFPLVVCILPAVGLLTVVPVAASAMRNLAL